MSTQIPWSVKGVEPSARESAKAAARRAGLTLGAWLNQVIRESGPLGEDEPALGHGLVRVAGEEPNAETLAYIVKRLNALEDKNGRIIGALESSLSEIAARLGAGTEGASGDAGVVAHVLKRLDALERKTAEKELALEHGLNEVSHRYSDIEARHERGRGELARAIDQLASRFEQARPDAAAAAAPADIERLRSDIGALDERLSALGSEGRRTAETVDKAVHDVENRLATSERRQRENAATLERALTLFNDRLQNALVREDNGTTEALRALEQAVTEISVHFDDIERRREEAAKTVEEQLKAISVRVAQSSQQDGTAKPIEAVTQMLERVERSEQRVAGHAAALAERLQDFDGRVERDETEFRAFRMAVMRSVDDLAERVGNLDSRAHVPPPPITIAATSHEPDDAEELNEPLELTESVEPESAAESAPEDNEDRAGRELRALLERARRRARSEEAESLQVVPELPPRRPDVHETRAADGDTRRRRTLLATFLVCLIAIFATFGFVVSGPLLQNGKEGRPNFIESLEAALGLKARQAQAPAPAKVKTAVTREVPKAPVAKSDSPETLFVNGLALAKARNPESAREGAALIGRAAALGHAEAQFVLGRLFETGAGGTKKDVAEAKRWYEESAAQGDSLAMHNLGTLALGEGNKRGDAQAAQWFAQAAERNLPESQFNLAILYELGRGVAADRTKAYAWYAAAAAQGAKDAEAARLRLAGAMTDEERAAAEARVEKRRGNG